jgi:hypothetical protein
MVLPFINKIEAIIIMAIVAIKMLRGENNGVLLFSDLFK